jgi:hypothetical protein
LCKSLSYVHQLNKQAVTDIKFENELCGFFEHYGPKQLAEVVAAFNLITKR